jgi:hypothetical protein
LKIRFQADADIDPDIRKGLLRQEPSLDFQPAAGIIPDGTRDPEVLVIGADDDRVLVSGDVRTMSVHFQNFIVTRESPKVLLIPPSRSIRARDRRTALCLAELDAGGLAQPGILASLVGNSRPGFRSDFVTAESPV